MKKLFLTILIVGGVAFTTTSCSKDECKCTGALATTFDEDDCDCDVKKECDALKAAGADCKVE